MKKVSNEQLQEDIKNYQLIIREYKRVSSLVENDEIEVGNQLISMQNIKGLESKSQSNRRLHRQKMKYGQKIETINKLMDRIDNDRDYAIIHCITDGMRIVDISKHLNVGRRTIYSVLEKVSKQAVDH